MKTFMNFLREHRVLMFVLSLILIAFGASYLPHREKPGRTPIAFEGTTDKAAILKCSNDVEMIKGLLDAGFKPQLTFKVDSPIPGQVGLLYTRPDGYWVLAVVSPDKTSTEACIITAGSSFGNAHSGTPM